MAGSKHYLCTVIVSTLLIISVDLSVISAKNNNNTAAYWIDRLGLEPHVEGGVFREVFRSKQNVTRSGNGTDSSANSVQRTALTSIYYLLEGHDHSAFHRLASDELWYFHTGEPLTIHIIEEMSGNYTTHELSASETGNFFVPVPVGVWFAAEIPSRRGFTVVSCAVAPGFEYAEFQLGRTEDLMARYPELTSLFKQLSQQQTD